MKQLQLAIDETSDESTEELTVVGDLLGASVSRKTFEIDVPDVDDRRMTRKRRIIVMFDDAINESQAAVLQKRFASQSTEQKNAIRQLLCITKSATITLQYKAIRRGSESPRP